MLDVVVAPHCLLAAGAPHPDRKSVLIEANAIFLNDMLGIGMRLQRAYRQGYGFDGRNSAITTMRGKPDLVAFQVLAHFATGSIAARAESTRSRLSTARPCSAWFPSRSGERRARSSSQTSRAPACSRTRTGQSERICRSSA